MKQAFSRRALPGLDVAYLDCTGHRFPKHAHDEFVIGANHVGRESIWLDGKSLEAASDAITLYNPGQLQAGGASGGPRSDWAFFSIYVDPAILPGVFGIDAEAVFERPVHAHAGLARQLREAAACSLRRDTSADEAAERITAVVGALFASVSAAPGQPTAPAGPAVARIAQCLLDNLHAPPALSDLARDQDMTPVQLVRAFSRQFGLPPYTWLMVERVKRARALLRTGQPIAAIAADLGFADQAHLTRRFKAMHGVSPAAWRRG